MRNVYCIICNYFEERTGNLNETLLALQRNKENLGDERDRFKVSIFDNGSTDRSEELIKKFVDLKVVDYAIRSAVNLGKARALNELFVCVKKKWVVEDDDIILHLDSDIRLSDTFIKDLLELYDSYNDMSLVFPTFTSNSDEILKNSFKFPLEKEESFEFNGNKVYKTKSTQIIGCCMAVKAKDHKAIDGYRELQGKDGLPLYGADDAVFILDISRLHPDQWFYIYTKLSAYHPMTEDIDYRNSKIQDCKKFNLYFSRVGIPDKINDKIKGGTGFYDGKIEIRAKKREFIFENPPHVKVIILNKDSVDLLDKCITSILQYTKYPSYSIRIVDTGSSEENFNIIKKAYEPFENIEIVQDTPYNFAKNNNHATEDMDKDDMIVFCNNDIEFKNDCISEMYNAYREYSNTGKRVGTVGSRLHFPDGKIQHVGIAVDFNSLNVGHFHYGEVVSYYSDNEGSLSKEYIQVFGNTAALMMIKKDIFDHFGKFNEEYRKCFEDVDLNFKIFMAPYTNICALESAAIHRESSTRKQEMSQLDFFMVKEQIAKLGQFAYYNNMDLTKRYPSYLVS